MYNERFTLTSWHKITQDGLTCHKDKSFNQQENFISISNNKTKKIINIFTLGQNFWPFCFNNQLHEPYSRFLPLTIFDNSLQYANLYALDIQVAQKARAQENTNCIPAEE